MSLEDQIRRLADARAAGVNTPDWRGRASGGRGRWLLAAAAVAVLAVVGAMIARSVDDDSDVDTADLDVEPTPTSPPSSPAPTTSTEPTPTTATTSTTSTTEPPPGQTGPCATSPVPDQDVLDLAVHLGPDRTPLDLDQDGVDDELLTYDDADGNWWLIARLQAGWTAPVNIGQPSVPGLALTPDGVPAGTDLDGDGGLEFFITGYLGESAGLVSLVGCELRDDFLVDSEPGDPGASFGVPLGVSAYSDFCGGRSCATRVSCADDVLTHEIFISFGVADDPGTWETTEVRLSDGALTLTPLPARQVGPFDDPASLADAPTAEDTGFVDCVPPTP